MPLPGRKKLAISLALAVATVAVCLLLAWEMCRLESRKALIAELCQDRPEYWSEKSLFANACRLHSAGSEALSDARRLADMPGNRYLECVLAEVHLNKTFKMRERVWAYVFMESLYRSNPDERHMAIEALERHAVLLSDPIVRAMGDKLLTEEDRRLHSLLQSVLDHVKRVKEDIKAGREEGYL